MSILTPYQVDTTKMEDGQSPGSIVPGSMRILSDSLAGTPFFTSTPTSSYTLIGQEYGTIIPVNVTAPATAIVFVPTNATWAADIGTTIGIWQQGTGTVGVAAVTPGTTTINTSIGTYVTYGRYSTIYLRKVATDTWLVSGELPLANFVPIQANYMPGPDFTQSYWTKNAFTATTSDTLRETATTALHSVSNTVALTRAAGIATYQMFADITPATDWVQLIVWDASFADSITAWFNVVGMAASAPVMTTWTAGSSWVLPLGGTQVRCGIQFTTDATTTNFVCEFNMNPTGSTGTYLGVVTNGAQIDNMWLYNVNAGIGGL